MNSPPNFLRRGTGLAETLLPSDEPTSSAVGSYVVERPIFTWTLFAVTILLETCGTMCMKLAGVDTKRAIYWQVAVYLFYAVSFSIFPLVLKSGLPLSIAYAMWAGIGTTLTVIFSAFFFAEPLTWLKGGSIGLIIVGVAGLNL